MKYNHILIACLVFIFVGIFFFNTSEKLTGNVVLSSEFVEIGLSEKVNVFGHTLVVTGIGTKSNSAFIEVDGKSEFVYSGSHEINGLSVRILGVEELTSEPYYSFSLKVSQFEPEPIFIPTIVTPTESLFQPIPIEDLIETPTEETSGDIISIVSPTISPTETLFQPTPSEEPTEEPTEELIIYEPEEILWEPIETYVRSGRRIGGGSKKRVNKRVYEEVYEGPLPLKKIGVKSPRQIKRYVSPRDTIFDININDNGDVISDIHVGRSGEYIILEVFTESGEKSEIILSFYNKLGVKIPRVDLKFEEVETSNLNSIEGSVITGSYVSNVKRKFGDLTTLEIVLYILFLILVLLIGYGINFKSFKGKKGQMFIVTAIIIIALIFMVTTTYNQARTEVVLQDFNSLAGNYESESAKIINYGIDRGVDIDLGDFAGFYVSQYARDTQPDFGVFYIVDEGGGIYSIHNFLPSGAIIRVTGATTGDLIIFSFEEQNQGSIGLDIGGHVFYNTVSEDLVNFDNGYAEADVGRFDFLSVGLGGGRVDAEFDSIDLLNGGVSSVAIASDGRAINVEILNN